MNSPVAYEFSDYKLFIKAKIEATPENRGLIGKLAEACGCQRSYFSKMLSEHVHLLPDHAFGLCEFWQMSDDEEQYFMTLLEYARSGSPRFRKRLENKLKKIKVDQENLIKRLNRPSLQDATDDKLIYYSIWYYSAIHILISIPEFQSPFEIAKRLQLPIVIVHHTLEQLRQFDLVTKENDKWKITRADLHLAKNSPLIGLHHNNWRQRAVLDAQISGGENLHYTVVQTMSHKSFQKLKQRMLFLIDEFAKEASPSKEEEIFNFNLDFFKV
jgi:uncharacterized protein (TIGR02147 family)